MKQNLKIADAIDDNPQHQTYDEYCKKILSNKQILAHIMKECVSEYKNVSIEEIPCYIEHDPMVSVSMAEKSETIKGRNNEDQSVSGSQVKYDILFDAKLPNTKETETIGLFINIEAQNSDRTPYPLLSRGVYYCSRLLARQKNQPDGFEHSDFRHLKKVYSIWIVMNTSKKREGVLNRYTIKEECLKEEYHFPNEEYDKLSIVMIYPKQEYDINDDEYSLMELLHILFKSKISSEEKKQQLTENYGIRMTRAISEEVESMCNLSQGFVDEGRAEGMEMGLAEGLEKGRAEGKAVGLEKGKVEGLSQAVRSLMNNKNMSMEEAMDLLDIKQDFQPAIINYIQNAQ